MTTLIKIRSGAHLKFVESAITGLGSSKKIEVWLPRNFKKRVFLDQWLTIFVATAAEGRQLLIRDFDSEWRKEEIANRFFFTIDGLSALYYSHALQNSKKDPCPVSFDDALDHVHSELGILEQERDRGNSITFCAVDPVSPRFIAFSGIANASEFERKFRAKRQSYFEVGIAKRYSEKVDPKLDSILSRFVFEAITNGYQHGRWDAERRLIPGLRWFRLTKRINYGQTKFNDFAKEFPEMQEYFFHWLRYFSKRTLFFYEVNVSDYGQGIVNHYINKKRDDASNFYSFNDEKTLLIDLFYRNISSSSVRPGSGYGLRRILEAVHGLKGFMTVRTGSQWLCTDPDPWSASTPLNLRSIKLESTDNPRVRGTHYGLLIPLMV